MEEIIYIADDIKSKLELERIIKSEKNLKEIFSFLGRKKLFNLIIYNKHLQNIFKINIEEYKSLSGKYKIGKKDGIGKVYKLNTNILISEGEYLNGERNGKGKEYYNNDKLKFEGEYLNGKKWNGNGYNINGNKEFEIKEGKGNIKEYDCDDKLIFEGQYLNGEINGTGKEYNDCDGKIEFKGEYLNR
jgi:antitoxin component YwqK of YwqJK toxin-antitoxin module